MYQIKCDNNVLLDLRDDDLILSSPKLDLETNTCGNCSFTIHSNHPYYDRLQKMKSVFTVLEDGNTIFKGRMLTDSLDWNNSKKVELEGILAYFNDSIISPFNFPEDWENDSNYSNSANVVEFFLNWIITQHNSQVQEFQKFRLGNVTVTDPNNYISRSSQDHITAWECLSKKLFDSSLGGYLCIRYEADGNYIDYLSSFPLTNTQTIEFGENLLNLTSDVTASETVSAVLPVGKDGITIETLSDGSLTSDLIKSGKVIYSLSAVNTYGYICAVQKWDDVTNESNLQTKGMNWLAQQGVMLSNSINLNAVDLHYSDDQIASFRINRNVVVTSEPHNYHATYQLTKLSIDLLKPQNTKIKLGNSFSSLTDVNRKDLANVDDKIVESGETIKREMSDVIDQESQRSMTEILQNCQSMIQTATAEYVRTGDFESYQQIISTQFEQTASEITMKFNETTSQINDVNGDLQQKYNERSKYIRFVDGDIILGEEGNELTLTIENDKMTFKQNGQDVAWFSNNVMHVTDSEFTKSAKIGKFAFVPGANGNLSFKKVGD